MKNRLFNAFMLLVLVGMMFTACKKEYPEPPIQDLPIGTVYTIGDIIAMESGTVFTEDASVYGIVTADEQSGNLYKAAFMQDRVTGDAIELYLNAVSGVRIGDSIRVYLKDVTYTLYNGLPQLSNFEADGHIVILANNKPIAPVKTTISEIKTGKYLAGLVRLENVWFTESNTFADPNTYGNRCLVDAENPTGSDRFVVRTSNYANFANDPLPSDTGNLVAIASLYRDTWQLIIRSYSELEFNSFNPGGGQGGEVGEVQALPYEQQFATSFGTYMAFSLLGDQKWEIDYSTAKMTGYANGTNYVNEDWLISSPVALTGVEHVKACVNYVAQYQNSNTEDVTLQVSRDYVFGEDPQNANWIQMDVTYPNTDGWQDFQTKETSLDEFKGETVTVAIKFVSSETQSRTMEVKYINIMGGEPGGGGVEPPIEVFSESFGSGQGSFSIQDVVLSSGLNYVWQYASSYSCMKASAYVSGQNHAAESWLVSPAIDLSGLNSAKLEFEQAVNYGSPQGALSVMLSANYNGDVTTANWVELHLDQWPAGSDWTFVGSVADLTPYVGQVVTIAFKYTSTNSASATWEVKKFVVKR